MMNTIGVRHIQITSTSAILVVYRWSLYAFVGRGSSQEKPITSKAYIDFINRYNWEILTPSTSTVQYKGEVLAPSIYKVCSVWRPPELFSIKIKREYNNAVRYLE